VTSDLAEDVFCRIVAGEEAAHVVLDDDVVVAFLDQRPVFPGHVLVVPRRHVITLRDLAPDEIGPYFERVQWVTVAVEDALEAHGSFVAMNNTVSQSVAHLHTHVVPRRRKDGLRGFFWPRQRYADDAEMAALADRIRARQTTIRMTRPRRRSRRRRRSRLAARWRTVQSTA
jgi:histidine triad (HIT) family protein